MNIFREYDNGIVARFAPATNTVGGQSVLQATVPDVTKPVSLGVGMPEDWFATFGMPYISIVRGVARPSPKRARPTFIAVAPSATVPGAVDVQRASPQAVDIPYAVELIADKMADANALLSYLTTTALPLSGFGTLVMVLGNAYPFRATAAKDTTNYATTQGRVFRYLVEYVVEGWVFSVDSDVVPMVLTVDQTLETYGDRVDLASVPAAALADEVDELVTTKPAP